MLEHRIDPLGIVGVDGDFAGELAMPRGEADGARQPATNRTVTQQ